VGKTSTARILAKALNCSKGPSVTSCEKCDICREITEGNSFDVLEIDGASNRGIDEIRNLRDNVKFKPAVAKYKIFIIDEVHMLTPDAFNALLKTLEEPPEHVKFIFATTELHKVPLTILSRCQRFAFRRLSTAKITDKLKEIADLEKIEYDAKALFTLAKTADGSLRDAESLLDQAASFGKGKISYKNLVEMMGTPEDETYLAIVKALLAKEIPRLLSLFSPLVLEGKEMTQFVRGLSEMFRALLILKVADKGARELIDLDPDMVSELDQLREHWTKEDLLAIVQFLQTLLVQVRRSPAPHLHIETALIKLGMRESLVSLSEILKKLEAFGKGNFSSQTSSAAPKNLSSAGAQPEKKNTVPSEITAPNPLPSTGSASEAVTLNEVERVWPEVLEQVKAQKMSCGTFLAEAAPAETDQNIIVLGLPNEFKFHKESLQQLKYKKIVETAFSECLGKNVRVSYVITVADKEAVPAPKEPEALPEIVESAVKIFEGKVVRKT